MNRLHRDIFKGEFVVVKKDVFASEFQDIRYRTVQVMGGFGMRHSNIGSALFVYNPATGARFRVEGHDLDRAETAALQAELDQSV